MSLPFQMVASDGHITQFSHGRIYRYTLWREWTGGSGYVQFVGLNPSTADERRDDPTIRRCVGFAKRWGYSALCMTNLFAYRATNPRDMMKAVDPVGPDNDFWLLRISEAARIVVAAWGARGSYLDRSGIVRALLGADLACIRVTKGGAPEHPLYLPGILVPIPLPKAPDATA